MKTAIAIEALLQRLADLVCSWWGHAYDEQPATAVIPLVATCGRCHRSFPLVKP